MTVCTSKGRVVYNRKMHPFTIRDQIRISRRDPLSASILWATGSQYEGIVDFIFQNPVTDAPPEFGGGKFGGGGASRDFDRLIAPDLGLTTKRNDAVLILRVPD